MGKKKTTVKKPNTRLEAIEKMYGKDFGVDASSYKKLANYLENRGYNGLSELLKMAAKNAQK